MSNEEKIKELWKRLEEQERFICELLSDLRQHRIANFELLKEVWKLRGEF